MSWWILIILTYYKTSHCHDICVVKGYAVLLILIMVLANIYGYLWKSQEIGNTSTLFSFTSSKQTFSQTIKQPLVHEHLYSFKFYKKTIKQVMITNLFPCLGPFGWLLHVLNCAHIFHRLLHIDDERKNMWTLQMCCQSFSIYSWLYTHRP